MLLNEVMLGEEEFVPPFATGKTPETCVVRPILPQLGPAPAAPEIRALPMAPGAASLESETGSFVPAYSRSPAV